MIGNRMELSLKQIVISGLGILIVGLAVGRYSNAGKTVTTETKTAEKDQTTKKIDTDKKVNRDIIIDRIQLPDGTIKTETHIVDKSETNTDTKIEQTITKSSDSKTTTTTAKQDWHVAVLTSMSHNNDNFIPGEFSYGVNVERRIIGPFTVGAFGLSNQTYGLSLGVSF